MKSNREIRDEAWRLLWKEGWFGRYIAVSVLLALVVGIVMAAIAFGYRALEIGTFQDFFAAQQKAASQGLLFSASNNESLMRMLGASLFQNFVQYLLVGIGTFGAMAMSLKAVRREREGWLGEAFSGFGAPFAMFWLMFSIQIRTLFWTILVVLPVAVVGSVALSVAGEAGVKLLLVVLSLAMLAVGIWLYYRYYCVWYLKADHPDWGAGKCVAVSVEVMKGRKGAAARLDCSCWLSFLWLLPLFGMVVRMAAKIQFGGGWGEASPADWAILAGVGVIALFYCAVVTWYLALGHAIFYRELSTERSPE